MAALDELCKQYDITIINKSNFNGDFNTHLYESHKTWLVYFMIKHGYDSVTYYIDSHPYFDLHGYRCLIEDFYEDKMLEDYIAFVDSVVIYFSRQFVVVFIDGEIKIGNYTNVTIRIEKTGELIICNSDIGIEKKIIFDMESNPADIMGLI